MSAFLTPDMRFFMHKHKARILDGRGSCHAILDLQVQTEMHMPHCLLVGLECQTAYAVHVTPTLCQPSTLHSSTLYAIMFQVLCTEAATLPRPKIQWSNTGRQLG